MTINSALTTQIAASSAPAKAGTIAGKPAASGGLAFFDLFLANAEKAIDLKLGALQTAKAGTQATGAQGNALLQSSALSLVNDQANLNITEALANSAYTTSELGKIENPQLTDILALNQQVDDEKLLTIKLPGTDGQISGALQNAILTDEADFRPALNNLQRILQKLQSLAQNDSPALIGTNVTPEQITALQKKVEDLLNGVTEDGKTKAEEFAGIFAGLIQILPPQPIKTETGAADAGAAGIQITGTASPQTQPPSEHPAGTRPGEDLAARLNTLIAGGDENDDQNANTAGQQKHQPGSQTLTPEQQQAKNQAQQQSPGEKWTLPESFKNLTDDGDGLPLKTEASLKSEGLTPKDLALAATAHAKAQTSGAAPDLSMLKNALPSLMSEAPVAGVYAASTPTGAEGYGLQLTSLSALSAGTASSTLAQTPQAGLLHPGTQMVAATLQRAGGAGQESRITLQLDPAELGRVEIKMSFEKNSKIKAVLTVEKPETHALLQKDSGLLERVLHDAGLDADGGLSFELAKEGYAFGRDDNQSGGQGNQSRKADAENGDEILQATMNWAVVDPDTGHTHYNIVA